MGQINMEVQMTFGAHNQAVQWGQLGLWRPICGRYANNQYEVIMNGLSKLLIRTLFLTAALVFGGIFPSYAADLQMFSNARLMNNPANDGDSFVVEANGKSFRLRLYFVDCPETSTSSKSDARRVREQTRYFGLSHAARTIHFGNEAKTFVEGILAKPFTVHTAFASALGRSAKGRVYGFITTADGDDLASLLVKNGLARTHGIGRKGKGDDLKLLNNFTSICTYLII